MKTKTQINEIKDRMYPEDWMEPIVESLVEKLTFYRGLLGTKEAAIERTKEESCGGRKAWKIALERLGW